MVFLLTIYKYILKFVYFFLKLLPTRKKQILFLSRQTNEPSLDFKYLIDDIHKRYPDYKVIVKTKRLEKNNPIQIISYLFHPFVQMYYLATSSVCVIDTFIIPVSCLKHKKSLRIIQIWHSLAAIKKFGYQTLNTDKDKKIAKVMCMHKNYDAIVSGSNEMTKHFSKAFNYPESKFITCGLPRIDYLLDTEKDNKKKVYKEYPELKNKKIVLYVPTFRTYDEYKFDEIIDTYKDSDYTLIIKKHERSKVDIDEKYTYPKVSSLELLSVADYVITDYSAIAVEASILNKPLYLYIYDLDLYNKYEGVNIDLYKELPGYVFDDIKDIKKSMDKNNYDMKKLDKYRKKYVTNIDGTSTKKLVDYIIGGKYEYKEKNKK